LLFAALSLASTLRSLREVFVVSVVFEPLSLAFRSWDTALARSTPLATPATRIPERALSSDFEKTSDVTAAFAPDCNETATSVAVNESAGSTRSATDTDSNAC
jgi:hypothetical protein